MKKNILYAAALIVAAYGFTACSKDDPKDASIFDDTVYLSEFDQWLDENYAVPYNIDFKYKFNLVATDMSFNLVPPTERNSIAMAKLVKFLWLDPYQVVRGSEFLREYAPRQIQIIGCGGWESANTMRLGTAEGGKKVTLYVGNWLDPSSIDFLNEFYFNTMHHEFGHILHQTKYYPREFNLISVGNYAPSSWFNRSEGEAAQLGFVSPYAGSGQEDDFVEIIARYLTYSTTKWNALLTLAGATGRPIIESKLVIVKAYMKDSWQIDLDQLRAELARRYTEIQYLDLYNI